MSDEKNKSREDESESESEQLPQGINLTLLYSLIGLALLAAIAVAVFIVLPFYHQSH